MSLTELIILAFPSPKPVCLFYFLSWKYDDTTICTVTNARGFPVTLNSILSLSPSLVCLALPLHPSAAHHSLLSPEIPPKPSPSWCSCCCCCCGFRLKAVPWPDQAARCPKCKHEKGLSRRGIMCKHRSWGFDCWDSLKTTLGAVIQNTNTVSTLY